MSARNEDFLFAQEAQTLGYVTEEQIEEGFLLLRRMSEELKIEERLAVILVKRGWMAEEQARRVYGIIEPEGAQTEIEGYRIVEKIGSGAMGTVYKAIHKGLHRVVAIKVLRRELATDKTQIERLKREAKLLADLDHPNIVRAFDAGESNGFPYLVMEYVEGESLRERIAREGWLSNEEALRITRALADALEKARRMGVVHRDVKPGNILISKSGTPKLMDLGLAKGPLDLSLTLQGATVGTPQFMSPEQAESPDKADTRSDIYSLGATLYAMVTGRPPFEGVTLAEIITKVMSQQPVPPRLRNPDVSPEVSHLIEHMMLKDAALRYATPAQVILDVDSIRGGQSILPRGFTGNWEAWLIQQRWRRRLRWGSVALVATLVLGFAGFTYWQRGKRAARQNEVRVLAAQVLALPLPGPQDTLEELGTRLASARETSRTIQRIAQAFDVSSGQRGVIDTRIRQFAEAQKVLDDFQTERRRCRKKVADGDFQEAIRRVDALKRQVRGVEPAQTQWLRLDAEVRTASRLAWHKAQRAALGLAAATLPDFVTKWRAFEAALHGRFDQSDRQLKAAIPPARAMRAAAEAIQAEVRRAEEAFAPEVVGARVQALEFHDLKGALRTLSHAVLSAVEAQLDVFHDQGRPRNRGTFVGPNGLVTQALARIDLALDHQVRRLWETLRDEARSLPPAEAYERLRRFEFAAARVSTYREFAKLAHALKEELGGEAARRQAEAVAEFKAVRKAVLRALGVASADGIQRAVDDARKLAVLTPELRKDVEGLRLAAPALHALLKAALTHAETLAATGRRAEDVQLREQDGTWRQVKKLKILRVDAVRRVLFVEEAHKGSRRREVEVPIERIDLPTVRAWAQQGGRELPALADALVDLAVLDPVHDDPRTDLRPLLEDYRAVLARFEAIDGASAWSSLVTSLVADLTASQERREALAQQSGLSAVLYFVGGKKFKLALQLIDELADPQGGLCYTDAFEKARPNLEKKRRICAEFLAREALNGLFYGGVDIVERPGGRHLLTWDFNDDEQLQNFERGLGLLEPAPQAPTTPYTEPPQWLRLLAGVEGWVTNRPLSMMNMLDPAEPIEMRLTIHTGAGSALFAVDIDGVQIAICSADPNTWRWRFDPSAPLLSDEEKLPAFDFYGRGRGIAFHTGPHFGIAFPLGSWDWSPLGQGRNFERWREPTYLARRREKLFAFEPGRQYQLRLLREPGKLSLWVGDDLIVQRVDTQWITRGGRSEINPKIRNGSGRIQILTWTPLAIDNLMLEGRVMKRWREMREREMKERKKQQGTDAEEKK